MLDYKFYLGHIEFHITRRFLVSMESKQKKMERLEHFINYGYHVSLVTVFVLARFSICLSRTVRTNLANLYNILIIA